VTYCEQCGSTSHDEQGFCRGCGTRLAAYVPAKAQGQSSSVFQPLPLAQPNSTQSLAKADLAQPQAKNVWVAVMLALLLGPVGLAYCTYLGMFVMLVITALGEIYIGRYVYWLLLPVCAVWARFAARSANSIY
jgi:hypothetical protein